MERILLPRTLFRSISQNNIAFQIRCSPRSVANFDNEIPKKGCCRSFREMSRLILNSLSGILGMYTAHETLAQGKGGGVLIKEARNKLFSQDLGFSFFETTPPTPRKLHLHAMCKMGRYLGRTSLYSIWQQYLAVFHSSRGQQQKRKPCNDEETEP